MPRADGAWRRPALAISADVGLALLAARKDIVLAVTLMVDEMSSKYFEEIYARDGFDPKLQAGMSRSLTIILCSQREARSVLSDACGSPV